MSDKVSEMLEAAAATFRGRNQTYGEAYVQFGEVAAALFPQGFNPKTPRDWARIGVMIQVVSKVLRYSTNINSGGHKDSAHDLCVYAAMLEELTDEENKG